MEHSTAIFTLIPEKYLYDPYLVSTNGMLPAKIKGLNQDTSDESNDEEEESVIITKEALVRQSIPTYVC